MPTTQQFNGPIPGENYTSNTKNYPWHRPPEITNMDKAIEASVKQLTTREGAFGTLNMLEGGMPVTKLAELFVLSGIGAGKWTLDFGILLAGPVAKIIETMAKSAKIKFDMGLDDSPIPTIEFYKQKAQIGQGPVNEAIKGAKNIEVPAPTGGFMGVEQ